MSPIAGLTDTPSAYIKLGNIRKDEKDALGKLHDLDYFRVTFMKSSRSKEIQAAFQKAYGEKPISINVRFAFPDIDKVWDATYECYKQGGLYFRAGSTKERGLYWIFYRDPVSADVLIRNESLVHPGGTQVLDRKIDLTQPMYTSDGNKPYYLKPVGRLEVVIPEIAQAVNSEVGYFEFRPESIRDIRNISAELGMYDTLARQNGRTLLGIPFHLFRREEIVTKKIAGKLTQGPSWVVHLGVDTEWAARAQAMLDDLHLPEVIETDPDSPEVTIPEEPEEMIRPLSLTSVQYAADTWKMEFSKAAIRIGARKLGPQIKKSEFLKFVQNPEP